MQKTSLNEDIFEEARAICANEGIAGQGPPLDPRVNDLVFGWSTDSKVDKQQGQFFRLTVDEKTCSNGFVLTCRGKNGCKFRMFLFDVNGNLLYQEEGVKGRGGGKGNPQATMHFTNFDTYRLNNSDTPSDKTIPEVFCKLESYTPSKKSVSPGKYLLCVHGDNFYGKTYFNLLAVPAHESADCVDKIKAIDSELVKTKIRIDDAKIDFFEKKAMYEAALAKAKEDELKLNELVKVRDIAYNEFLDNSERPYRAETAASNESAIHDIYPGDPATIDAVDSILTDQEGGGEKTPPMHKRASALISGAFVVGAEKASGVASGVSATATAASGWLGGKFGQLKSFAASKLASKKDTIDTEETNEASESAQNADRDEHLLHDDDYCSTVQTTGVADINITSQVAPTDESFAEPISSTLKSSSEDTLIDLTENEEQSEKGGIGEAPVPISTVSETGETDADSGCGENSENTGKKKNKKKGKK